MTLIYDVDALLILSIELAAKRRPAELVDIVAASELLNRAIPSEAKLIEAFARLSARGLIQAAEDGYVLHPTVQAALSKLPRKAEADERLFTAKQLLADLKDSLAATATPLTLAADALSAALTAHRATANLIGKKNLFMPKPEPQATATKGPGFRQRKPLFKAAGKPGSGGKAGGKSAAPRRRKV